MKMRLNLGLLLITAAALALMSWAQAPPQTPPTPPAYVPDATQSLRLEVAQLKLQLAQTTYAAQAQRLPEFAQFQASLIAMRQECDRVRTENKWPEAVQCDVSAAPVKFAAPAPAAQDVPVPAPVSPAPSRKDKR